MVLAFSQGQTVRVLEEWSTRRKERHRKYQYARNRQKNEEKKVQKAKCSNLCF